MRTIVWLTLISFVYGCSNGTVKQTETPAPIGDDETELIAKRKKWFELIHTAAPKDNWRMIEASNVEANILLRNTKRMAAATTTATSTTESFAGGKIKGEWNERGSVNQAGSIIAADYDSVANNLYVVSAAGSIWRNNGLAANNWTLLNDDYIFDNQLLKVFNRNAGGSRILAKRDVSFLYRSDNEGGVFTQCTVNYPVSWNGSNNITQLEVLRGNSNIIYALAYIWNDNPWQPRMAIFRSTDEGATFNRIYTLLSNDRAKVKMVQPYNSQDIYLFDAQAVPGNITIYSVSGTTVSQVNTVAQPEALTGNLHFKATTIGAVTSFYFTNNNSRVFRSDNLGASWTFKGTLPAQAWDRLDVSNTDADKVYSGAVECMRSTNGGASWAIVNGWSEYYGNIVGKLHADIMNIVHFKKADGTPFAIINNHGGVSITYDNTITNTNLSVTGLKSAQYYDILTAYDNLNYIYGGTQDQGLHKNTTALTPGGLSFAQTISGDFGYLALSDLYRTLYTQYPGGSLYIFSHPTGSYLKNWVMPGTQKPNYGWMLPMENTYNPVSDTVLMGGGNLTGGGGSYLCRIRTQNTSPYTVSASQYNYDFRANSRTTSAGITAIEACPAQPQRFYVATEDGSFFRSNDNGASWAKSTTFSAGGPGPWYLYGSTIVSSRLTNDLVWYGGSGYSNAAVWKSADGGETFTAMSNGLPNTLVHEIVANIDESMLFAATDAGPYVYIVEDNQWYSLIGANTPIQNYTSVEYIHALNTVRFATYGRGIHDFAISEPYIYYYYGTGNWTDITQWGNQFQPPASSLTGNHRIFINPLITGECILDVPYTLSAGARLVVSKGRKFRVNGNLTINQ